MNLYFQNTLISGNLIGNESLTIDGVKAARCQVVNYYNNLIQTASLYLKLNEFNTYQKLVTEIDRCKFFLEQNKK